MSVLKLQLWGKYHGSDGCFELFFRFLELELGLKSVSDTFSVWSKIKGIDLSQLTLR